MYINSKTNVINNLPFGVQLSMLLDVGEWDRMLEGVTWSRGDHDDSTSPETDIRSYSEEEGSSTASCHSPEIRRKMMEDHISEVRH